MLLWIGLLFVTIFSFWFWNGSWLNEESNLDQLRAEQASISRHDPLSRPPSEDEFEDH